MQDRTLFPSTMIPIPSSHPNASSDPGPTGSFVPSSFIDGFKSYQRSQLLISGSTYTTTPVPTDDEDDDPPANSAFLGRRPDLEQAVPADEDLSDCDDGLPSQPGETPVSRPLPSRPTPPRHALSYDESSPLLQSRDTPPYLMRKPSSRRLSARGDDQLPANDLQNENYVTDKHYVGSSTFGQTLFNCIAILVGIGMLSEPLAFSYAGWVGGTILLVMYAAVGCYTAIILANMIFKNTHMNDYMDITRAAFGSRSTLITSSLFCLELFSLSVVLITLFADSLHALFPAYPKSTYKFLSLLIIIPTSVMPLSMLAYTSIIGIASSILMIYVVLYDGLMKDSSPGSITHPCPTQLVAAIDLRKTGVAFGLFMAGFSGHAVIPSIAIDMKEPSQFPKMIRRAFVVSTLIYAVVGGAGYLMFGDAVSDEVSQDLLRTPGFDRGLNQVLMWMLVIMPISKFALGTRPLNTTVETWITRCFGEPSLGGTQVALSGIVRATTACLSVLVSVAIPEFSSMMAFLGSFSAFTICIILPVAAHIVLDGGRWWDHVILVSAAIMAAWGTAVAFV